MPAARPPRAVDPVIHATPTLSAIARALAARPELWAPVLEHDPHQRLHLRLAALDAWEAWLITWPSGQGVEVHDHGDSAGAIAVLDGELVEVVTRPASKQRPGAVARHNLTAGTVRNVPLGRVHDVLNLGTRPAISLHVYGPALTTMTFYDDALRPTRTERVYPETPRLAAEAVRAALDPTLRG